MNTIKQARIEALKHSIEITEQRIEETTRTMLSFYARRTVKYFGAVSGIHSDIEIEEVE